MKRSVIGGFVAGGLALVLAPLASAQQGPAVTGKGGEDRALSLQLSGSADLQLRYASSVIQEGVGIDNRAGTAGNQADSMWVGSPKVNLRLDAALSEKGSAVLELEVPRIDGGGNANFFGSSTGGGGGSDITLGVRQVYVQLAEIGAKELNVRFGIQDYTFDPAGQGRPEALALGHAESAWQESNAATPAVGAGTFRDELRFGGLLVCWKNDMLDVDFFHMFGGSGGAVNSSRNDEYATGLDLTYSFDKDKKTNLGAIISVFSGTGGAGAGVLTPAAGAGGGPSPVAGGNAEVWLYGAGIGSDGLMGNVQELSVYLQVFKNGGTYGQGTGGLAGGPSKDIDASGLLWDLGGDYRFALSNWKLKAGAEYLSISGNKIPTAAGVADSEYEGFVGYEDDNELVILQDKEFGFDLDQNLNVIKVRASLTGDLIASPVKDNFTLDLVIGLAQLDEKVPKAAPLTGTTDDLGTEVDLKASWAMSKQVSFYAGIGWLSGADVLKDTGISADDSANTFFLGTKVTF